MLFGGFIEHFNDQVYGGLFEPGSPLSDEHGFRKDVIAAMKELKLPVVRWPGGCFVSGYHWKDGVGKTRKPVADPVWGVTDPNTFGTDEFIAWCRLVGCEPYICTNAGNGTPEEMKQWVEYCNATKGEYAELRKANGSEKPFNVKYWSIGNENYGYWEIGRQTPETWGPFVHKCAGLMRAADPDIELAAAAWLDKREWNLPLLKAAGQDLKYMAVHQYWLRTEKPTPFKSCMGFSNSPEKTIASVISLIEEAGFRGKIKIAYDEWNLRGWHHPGFPRKSVVKADDEKAAEFIAKRSVNAIAEQYTMGDALFTASFLNACLRHCEDVGMANIAPIVNTRGPLYVHPKGIVRRTTFHTLAMYANLLEGRVAKFAVEGGPQGGGKQPMSVIDAVATVDAAGKNWAIALVNSDPSETVACTVKLGDRSLDGTFDATILAGDSPEAYNDVERPNRVVPEKTQLKFNQGVVNLPPHSLTIVRIRWK
jgi:alpha-N-arabinofuranosidase